MEFLLFEDNTQVLQNDYNIYKNTHIFYKGGVRCESCGESAGGVLWIIEVRNVLSQEGPKGLQAQAQCERLPRVSETHRLEEKEADVRHIMKSCQKCKL